MSEGNVTAVVIGRGGSKGLPRKNVLPLGGRPLIAWSVDAARSAVSVTRIVVSTDDEEIAAAATGDGVEVVMRPAELADDLATVDSAVRHAIDTLADAAPIVVILYANVPIRPKGLIDDAVAMLQSTGANSVQSYADVSKHHPWWMVTVDDDGRVTPYVENTAYRRQDLPPVFLPDGGVIAVTREALFTVDPAQPHAFLGSDRRGIRTGYGAVVDIDTAADLRVAESMLNAEEEA